MKTVIRQAADQIRLKSINTNKTYKEVYKLQNKKLNCVQPFNPFTLKPESLRVKLIL